MTINYGISIPWDLLVPWGYLAQYKTLRDVERALIEQNYHPNYIRVVIPWLASKGGDIGVGGLSRTVQPDRPGFAPTLQQTFHWREQGPYADGWIGPSAIDFVAKDGPDSGASHDTLRWDQVPKQGSAEAARVGLHMNVSTESWHGQGIKIDGHATWVRDGRPVPVAADFPLPGIVVPPTPTPGAKTYTVQSGDGWNRIANALGVTPQVLDAKGRVIRAGKVIRTSPIGNFVVWPGDVIDISGAAVEQTYRNTPPPTVPPELVHGDSGDRVRQLQIVLKVQADGRFGPATEAAVKLVQHNLGVVADGRYGPKTDAALRAFLKSVGLPA